MENYGLNAMIEGREIPAFLADFIERNEEAKVDLERGKLTISALKQLNNYSRLALDAEKFKLKQMEAGIKKIENLGLIG